MNLGSFPSNPAMQIADLQRRLAALERLAPIGSGVSTMFGRPAVRIMQPGFPAELTSTWDATTGYSWQRLTLDGVALDPNDAPITGDYAVTPDGDETLASGTRGWMEPDQDAGGWLFVTPPPGSSSLTSGESTGSGYVETTTEDTWTTSPAGITLPSAGTYLVTGILSVFGQISSGPPGYTFVRLWDNTNSTALGSKYVGAQPQVVDVTDVRTVTVTELVTVAGSIVVRPQVRRDTGGCTWTSAGFSLSGSDTPNTLNYVKIA